MTDEVKKRLQIVKKKARKDLKQAQLEFDTLAYRRNVNFHSMPCSLVELHTQPLFCKKNKYRNKPNSSNKKLLFFRKTMVEE